MDFDTITGIASAAGVGSGTLANIAVASIVASAIGRAIPDNKKGILGVIRKIAKVVGLYVPNRVSSDDSTASVEKQSFHGEMIQHKAGPKFEIIE